MSGISFKGFVLCDGTCFRSGYLQCIDAATMSLVQKYSPQIQTLSYSQAIVPLPAGQPAPEGCAVAIASDRCTVNLMLKVRRDHFSSNSFCCLSLPAWWFCHSFAIIQASRRPHRV